MEVVLETVPPEITESPTGFQNYSRDYRMESGRKLLESLFPGVASRYVCTGHHWDDQVETILMKFLRGVYISKLSGVS